MGEIVNKNLFYELARLKEAEDYLNLKNLFSNPTFSIQENKIASHELYSFFEKNHIDPAYWHKDEDSFWVDKQLTQLILIDLLLADKFRALTLSEISESLKQKNNIYKSFLNSKNTGIVIAYLHQFGLESWTKFVAEGDFQWNNINAISTAMLLIELDAEEVLSFFEKLHSSNNSPTNLNRISHILIEKLKKEPKLAEDIEKNLTNILQNEKLYGFINTLITGLSLRGEDNFLSLLNRLKDASEHGVLFEIFRGFIRSCSIENREILENIIYGKFREGKILKFQYIQLCADSQTLNEHVTLLLVEPLENTDVVAVYEYLYNLAESQSSEDWYKKAALAIYSVELEDLRTQLDFLLYNLSSYNLNLVYDILTVRFESLGSNLFLKEHLDYIINLDRELFMMNLTKWFNSEHKNVHKSLLKLTSGRILSETTKISSIYFKSLSTEERVYICFKIAGYVYSMEHLQSLLFSVLDATESDDIHLLAALSSIFSDYLIYNYRSTLEQIEQRLANKECFLHQKAFFQPIVESYNEYFERLKSIRLYNELQADLKLEEFVRFYKSQLFASSMKKSNDRGFLSMMKSVNLHSKNWAIRRSNQKIHEVQPLGYIEHSVEFPSGEKLNPTFHETLRRNFQRIQKHEINFS